MASKEIIRVTKSSSSQKTSQGEYFIAGAFVIFFLTHAFLKKISLENNVSQLLPVAVALTPLCHSMFYELLPITNN